MTLIEGDRPATIEEIAAMTFEAVEQTKNPDAAKYHARWIGAYARIAREIVTYDKAALVALVRENPNAHGEGMLQLGRAATAARILLEFIETAEARLAVALAVVEIGDDDPNEPDEEPLRAAA